MTVWRSGPGVLRVLCLGPPLLSEAFLVGVCFVVWREKKKTERQCLSLDNSSVCPLVRQRYQIIIQKIVICLFVILLLVLLEN